MNRRWKAVAIGAITAAAGIGVGTYGVELASAHASVVTGTSACQTDGTYTVSWTVANDYNSIEDVTYVSRTGGGTFSGLPVTIAASPGQPYKTNTTPITQSGISGSTTSVSLTIKGSWHDGYSQNNTGTVTLAGTCNQVTGAAPTYTEPTCANNTATVNYTAKPHVTYTTSPTAAPGATVTTTAHADAGWVLTGTTQWSHQFTSSPTNCVTGAAPTYTEPTCANNTATVNYTAVAHVTYTTAPAAAPGANVTTTAHADAGYVLVGTTQWTHQFNASPTNCVTGAAPTYTEPTCANNTATVNYTAVAHVTYTTAPAAAPGANVTTTAHADAGYVLVGTTQWTHQFNASPTNCVLPVAPVPTTHTECGVADTFSAGPTTGVVYSTDGINFFATVTGNLVAGNNVGVVTAKADNGYVLAPGAQTSFDLTGSSIEICSTPVAPAVTVKTDCGVNDTFTAGPTTGVLYSTDGITYTASVNGTLNAGNNIGVVKAKADAGYALTAGSPTSFDLVGSAIEKCGEAEPPTVVTTADCGVKDTFSAGPTTGVLYSTDGVTFTPTVAGSLDAGQTVTVTAGPDTANGYNFPTETFTVTGGPVEVCPITTTPVAPNIVTPPCGEPATFTTTPVTGVVYSQTSGTLTPGADTVITVTPAAGYVLAAGSPTSYTLTGPAIVACEDPTTTTAGVSVEAPAPTTTVAIVAPPAPEAPPLGLPETGSSNTMELLLGGFLLIAGASMLGFVRRRSVKVKS